MLGLFIFLTTFYCLLYYVPFSRHVLFGWDVVPALNVFANYHAIAFWVIACGTVLTVIPYLKEAELRRPTILFIVVLGIAAVALSFRPLLPNLPPDERSLVFGLVSLFPLCGIAAIDWKSKTGFKAGRTANLTRVSLKSIMAMAACVSGLYLGIFLLRYVFSGSAGFTRFQLVFFALSSFALHVILFGIIFLIFRIANAISRNISESPRLAFVVQSTLLALALAAIIRKVVFTSVSFNGVVADLTAVAIAFSFVAYFSTSFLRLGSLDSPKHGWEIRRVLGKVSADRKTRWLVLSFIVPAISVFAYVTLVKLEGLDWQGLFQRISVLAVWVATMVVFRSFSVPRATRQLSLALLILIVAGGAIFYAIIQREGPRIARPLRQRGGAATVLIERYADYDPSFKVAAEKLAPATVDVFEGSGGDRFFALLREHTNLPPEIEVAPREFNLVDEIRPARNKPNIFIFVIDSLRQDYLSPYNARVSFTPAIADFAHDSVVMKNAFTRYDGTALAEPSIWSGGMQVHKQFVEPFYPMNSLQRLVDAQQYRSFISIDPVLRSILRPSNEIVELDRGVDWKQQDLVATLSELQTHLQSEQARQPYFVYSQPQNLHQVSLKLNPRVEPVHHAGFEDRRAAEVGRIDKAFGDFVSFMKACGIYEDSIIILTADHGDSLGDGGHWGHGNAIYPELIRIPLIVHLPESLKRDLVCDPNSLAFSTDITPTLYYLLGQRPIRNDVIFGRPLFTATWDEQAAYRRDSYLIGDSYGPVYALLRDNGRRLFVADGVRNQAYIYDLSPSYAGERVAIDDQLTAEYEQALTSELKNIQLFYGYQPPSQAVPDPAQPGKIAQLYSLLFSK